MSNAETKTKRANSWNKIKWAVMIVILLFAIVFVPARFLAVRYANQGTELYNQGRYDEAMAKYERALRFYPWLKAAREPLGESYNEKAQVEFARREYIRAERLYRKGLKLGFDAAGIHYDLAQVCWHLGKKDEALIQLEEHLKQNSRDRQALRLLREISEIIPEFSDAPLILGRGVIDLCVAADGRVYYADHFGNSLGFISKDSKEMNVLLTGLNGPLSVAAFGTDVYFTEAGSQDAKYRDGALCVLRTRTGKKETITGGLQYPARVFVDAAGAIYVLEAAGSQTSFGGRNRLLRFPPRSTSYDVVLSKIRDPESFVLDRSGNVYIGTIGTSSPGDTGELLVFRRGKRSPNTFLSNLPSVHDMAIDSQGNLYIAGVGDDESEQVAIVFVPEGRSYFVPIMRGFQAWCLALDPAGNVYYSTIRGPDSVRVLRRKGAPEPELAPTPPEALIQQVEDSLPDILQGLRGEDWQRRPYERRSLAGLLHRATVPILVGFFKDESLEVRLRAARVLGDIYAETDADVVAALVKALGNEECWRRWRAAAALGEIGAAAEDALPELRKLAEGDEDSDVRQAAHIAMKAIEKIPEKGQT